MMESMDPLFQQFQLSAVPKRVLGYDFCMSAIQPRRSSTWYVPRYKPSEPIEIPYRVSPKDVGSAASTAAFSLSYAPPSGLMRNNELSVPASFCLRAFEIILLLTTCPKAP